MLLHLLQGTSCDVQVSNNKALWNCHESVKMQNEDIWPQTDLRCFCPPFCLSNVHSCFDKHGLLLSSVFIFIITVMLSWSCVMINQLLESWSWWVALCMIMNNWMRSWGFLHFSAPFFYKVSDILAKPDPTNVAYSVDELVLHEDMINLENTPGILILHCKRWVISEN